MRSSVALSCASSFIDGTESGPRFELNEHAHIPHYFIFGNSTDVLKKAPMWLSFDLECSPAPELRVNSRLTVINIRTYYVVCSNMK